MLAGHRHWRGGGKWLHRELVDYDRTAGSNHAGALAQAVRDVGSGSVAAMVSAVEAILDDFGGPLFDGFTAGVPDDTTRS